MVTKSILGTAQAYYSEIWARKNSFNEASILAELPMSLRSEIAFNLTRYTQIFLQFSSLSLGIL